jgi:hypothetical protein
VGPIVPPLPSRKLTTLHLSLIIHKTPQPPNNPPPQLVLPEGGSQPQQLGGRARGGGGGAAQPMERHRRPHDWQLPAVGGGAVCAGGGLPGRPKRECKLSSSFSSLVVSRRWEVGTACRCWCWGVGSGGEPEQAPAACIQLILAPRPAFNLHSPHSQSCPFYAH